MPRLYLLIFVFSFCYQGIKAQRVASIFPSISGTPLLDSLARNFRPSYVLSYEEAKDTMFGIVDNRDNWVRCVYTGHTRYLTPGTDPTNVQDGGSANGINAEHTYPQSKGASVGNGRSDLHHLFPTRAGANSSRGNMPFCESPDNQTDRWFYLTQELSSRPSTNIDKYSERNNNICFEPREDFKGNIARAMFYFYTMYRSQADAADPNFFPAQRLTLCQWHDQDPVDQIELQRTWKIAEYQDGKPNPFVLDCTLAARAYCTESINDTSCINQALATSLNQEATVLGQILPPSPQPLAQGQNLNLRFSLDQDASVRWTLLEIHSGRQVLQHQLLQVQAGYYQQALTMPNNLASGFYILHWEIENAQGHVQQENHKIFLYD